MDVRLTWEAVGIILAILGHAAFSIWWASKINTTVTLMSQSLTTNFQKTDVQIAALWKRSDELRDMIQTKGDK